MKVRVVRGLFMSSLSPQAIGLSDLTPLGWVEAWRTGIEVKKELLNGILFSLKRLVSQI